MAYLQNVMRHWRPLSLEMHMASRFAVLLLTIALLASTSQARRIPADSARTFRPYLAALNVKDASQTADWYVENLGFAITKFMDFPQSDSLRIIFLRLDAFELEVIQKRGSFDIRKYVPDYDPEKAPVHGVAKLAFMARGVKQMADGLGQRGVKILYGPFEDEPFGILTVIIEDLEGNLLQFSEPLEPRKPGK